MRISRPEKMAALAKAVRVSQTINNVTKLFANFSLSSSVPINSSLLCTRISINPAASFHTTIKRPDLMEFFDTEKNWGKQEVKSGRSWKKDELRIKSNEDLHKLWFVLLKERNMLLTMEENCKKHWEIFPSPERIDKIRDSMENLECVVRERNKAYHLLETGENGERPSKMMYNQIGLKQLHRMRQYAIPCHMNLKWRKEHKFPSGGRSVRKFLRLYNEKLQTKKHIAMRRQYHHVRVLFRKFPNMDIEALKAKFPNVDIEKVRNEPSARGHAVPQ